MVLKKRPEKKTTKSRNKVRSERGTAAADMIVLDAREQLFNQGSIGPINAVQVSAPRITQVLGLMFDLDPGLLLPDGALGEIPHTPAEFYTRVVKPMLDRNPMLAKAEVRNSGNGLHVILRFDQPYQCDTDAARDDISKVAEVVLCLLPADPMQPGITALTRPLGSQNSKNGSIVELLAPGEPVTYADVRELAVQFVASPLAMLCEVLFGGDRISPCPVCRRAESVLVTKSHQGYCYDCGQITLQQIYNGIYRQSKGRANG